MDAKPTGEYDHRKYKMKVKNDKEGWEWTVYPEGGEWMGQIKDMNMFQVYGHLVNNVNMVLDSQYLEDIDASMLADFVGMLLEVYGLTEEVLAILISEEE